MMDEELRKTVIEYAEKYKLLQTGIFNSLESAINDLYNAYYLFLNNLKQKYNPDIRAILFLSLRAEINQVGINNVGKIFTASYRQELSNTVKQLEITPSELKRNYALLMCTGWIERTTTSQGDIAYEDLDDHIKRVGKLVGVETEQEQTENNVIKPNISKKQRVALFYEILQKARFVEKLSNSDIIKLSSALIDGRMCENPDNSYFKRCLNEVLSNDMNASLGPILNKLS